MSDISAEYEKLIESFLTRAISVEELIRIGDKAGALGVTRPRLKDLMRGKLKRFSLNALVNIATAAGFRLHIELEDAA